MVNKYYMKRRNFIRNISSLGLASVAMGTSFAAESPQNSNSPGKSKIPVYDEWDVIVVGRRNLRDVLRLTDCGTRKVPKPC